MIFMKDEKPLISVIITTYRRHDKLNRALESVVQQTYENLEIIVVNDCPQENIDEYISVKDPRIKTINLEDNLGASEARNQGIKDSNGKYITFLDDDDEYMPNKIKRQVERIQSLPDDFGVVAIEGNRINTDGGKERKAINLKDGMVFDGLIEGETLCSVTPLVKKEVFENVGYFDKSLSSCQDIDMWLRAAKKYKVSIIKKPLYKYHVEGDDKITKNPKKRLEGQLSFLKKHIDEFKKHPNTLSKRYLSLGFEFFPFSRNNSFRFLIKSIKTKINIRAIGLLLLLLLPKEVRGKLYNWYIKERDKFDFNLKNINLN